MASDTVEQISLCQVKMQPDELRQWMGMLVENFRLIAPRLEGGILLYRPVDSVSQIEMDYIRPVMSLKDVFFPPTEQLFTIKKYGQHVELIEQEFNQPQVVWGVRSCDARGMHVLDAAFLKNDPVDVYYARRRQQTTLIGLVCHEPGPSCFCEQTGGAPDDPAGMDIMVNQVSDGFLVNVLTREGQQLMDSCGFRMDQWNRHSWSANIGQAVAPGDSARHLRLPDWSTRMTDPYWLEVAERCLSCRVCAYVCPTCRCFDIRDEVASDLTDRLKAFPAAMTREGIAAPDFQTMPGVAAFDRIRCWDSCTGENYRQIGGGHRPRAEKGERLRNRFLCKFYYYPEQYHMENQIACTGCGRCVEACPVNIDIREVIEHVEGWVNVT